MNITKEQFATVMVEDYDLPDYMVDGMWNYVVNHIPAGSFLMYLLQNDFINATMKADSNNLKCLGNYGSFFFNVLPADCFGSREKVQKWLEKGV